jgi:hypothetical protein
MCPATGSYHAGSLLNLAVDLQTEPDPCRSLKEGLPTARCTSQQSQRFLSVAVVHRAVTPTDTVHAPVRGGGRRGDRLCSCRGRRTARPSRTLDAARAAPRHGGGHDGGEGSGDKAEGAARGIDGGGGRRREAEGRRRGVEAEGAGRARRRRDRVVAATGAENVGNGILYCLQQWTGSHLQIAPLSKREKKSNYKKWRLPTACVPVVHPSQRAIPVVHPSQRPLARARRERAAAGRRRAPPLLRSPDPLTPDRGRAEVAAVRGRTSASLARRKVRCAGEPPMAVGARRRRGPRRGGGPHPPDLVPA